jgi:hypothetical protein
MCLERQPAAKLARREQNMTHVSQTPGGDQLAALELRRAADAVGVLPARCSAVPASPRQQLLASHGQAEPRDV